MSELPNPYKEEPKYCPFNTDAKCTGDCKLMKCGECTFNSVTFFLDRITDILTTTNEALWKIASKGS